MARKYSKGFFRIFKKGTKAVRDHYSADPLEEIKETGLEEHVKDSDLVITGEGRLDGQSYMGKAPIGVAKLAKKYQKCVIAFSGCVTDDARLCNEHGIDAFFPILKAHCTLEDAMNKDNAYKNLRDTAEQALRLVKTVKKY